MFLCVNTYILQTLQLENEMLSFLMSTEVTILFLKEENTQNAREVLHTLKITLAT